jgi:hypothetical protein
VTLREISEVGRRAPLDLYHALVGCDSRFLLASDEKLAGIVGPIHVLRLVVGLSDSLVRQATARLAGIRAATRTVVRILPLHVQSLLGAGPIRDDCLLVR